MYVSFTAGGTCRGKSTMPLTRLSPGRCQKILGKPHKVVINHVSVKGALAFRLIWSSHSTAQLVERTANHLSHKVGGNLRKNADKRFDALWASWCHSAGPNGSYQSRKLQQKMCLGVIVPYTSNTTVKKVWTARLLMLIKPGKTLIWMWILR